MTWRIVLNGPTTPEVNMNEDMKALETIQISPPTLTLYRWAGECATYGHFIDFSKYIDLNRADEFGLKHAKRPTGGGIMFHQCDLAFSVIYPIRGVNLYQNTVENYTFINNKITKVIELFSAGTLSPKVYIPSEIDDKENENAHPFCMAKPTIYDLVIDGRKVAGGAQRRTKFGLLYQGSISLTMPSRAFLFQFLKEDGDIAESIESNSYFLVNDICTSSQLNKARVRLQQLMISIFCV